MAPFMAVIAVIGLVGALISLAAPLLPVALLGLFGWAIFRTGSKKPAAPQPPEPGFWS
jgi:hypothetical protein